MHDWCINLRFKIPIFKRKKASTPKITLFWDTLFNIFVANEVYNDFLDQLSFSTTSGDKFGSICGTESYSQHLYLDTGVESGDSLTISFSINNAPTSASNRYWSIRVIQVRNSWLWYKWVCRRLPSSFIELEVCDKRRTDRHMGQDNPNISMENCTLYNLKSHAEKNILVNQSGTNSGICSGRVWFFFF